MMRICWLMLLAFVVGDFWKFDRLWSNGGILLQFCWI